MSASYARVFVDLSEKEQIVLREKLPCVLGPDSDICSYGIKTDSCSHLNLKRENIQELADLLFSIRKKTQKLKLEVCCSCCGSEIMIFYRKR